MIRKSGVFLLLALCLFSLCGCTTNGTADNLMKKNVNITLGKEVSTLWFDFTIISIDEVVEYVGYYPAEGYKLIDILITETSTFEDEIPMGIYDFYIDCENLYDYVYPLEPFNSSMMPFEFYLDYGETVEYHMIFEIPDDTKNPLLIFTEIYEDEEEGSTFMLSF